MRRTVTIGDTTLVVQHLRGWRVWSVDERTHTAVWVRGFEHPFIESGDHREALCAALEEGCVKWPVSNGRSALDG